MAFLEASLAGSDPTFLESLRCDTMRPMTHNREVVTQGTSPRVGVSLPPHVYALYKAFAQVSGRSMSSMLAEIAVTSAPALERVLRVALAAKEAEQARKAGLQQAAQEAEQQLAPLLAEVQQTLGVALDHIEEAATAAQPQPHRGRRARAPDPRPSNTGVRSPRKKGKKRVR